MLHFLSVAFCALAFSDFTVQDGQGWLKKAEGELYRWPKPASIVHFEAHTDVLAPMLAAMKRELEKKPDAEASRFVAALEKLEVSGSIDTLTGRLQTEIKVDYTPSDTRTKAALETITQRVQATFAGCFASLPLQDPTLLRKGSVVSGAEEREGERIVTADGACPGERTVLHFARDTGLPTAIELPDLGLVLGYTEATPGRYVPASLEMHPRGGSPSRADFQWQKKEELWFPEHVRLSSPNASAKIDFDQLVVEHRVP